MDSSAKSTTPDGLSPGTAFALLAEAVEAAQPGDTIALVACDADGNPRYYSGVTTLQTGRHRGITIMGANIEGETGESVLPVIRGLHPYYAGSTKDERREAWSSLPQILVLANDVTIQNVEIECATGAAIAIGEVGGALVENTKLINCRIHHCRGQAVYCVNAARTRIADAWIRICNDLEGSAAIEIHESRQCAIIDNVINNPLKQATGGGVALTNSIGCTVDRNQIQQLTDHPGIRLAGTLQTSVDRNLIHDCGSGIEAVPSHRPTADITVYSNIVAECHGDGISVQSPKLTRAIRLIYNTVRDCQGAGILTSGQIRSSYICNNALLNNTGFDLQVECESGLEIAYNAARKGGVKPGLIEPTNGIELAVNADGRVSKPQLLIDKNGNDPHDPENYEPLPDSSLRDSGRKVALSINTNCAAAHPRNGSITDIGAVEYLPAAEKEALHRKLMHPEGEQ